MSMRITRGASSGTSSGEKMDAKERRKYILDRIGRTDTPVSASALASELSVSRQVIVGDVSILRAEGNDVRATARGYLPERKREQFPFVGTIVCRHDDSGLADELFTIVDYGGTCIDVTIEHAIYGELSGQLNIGSRYEAEQFIEKSRLYPDAKPLSLLSGGLHMHNVGAPSREVFDLICGRLREKGILVEISGE